MSSDPNFRASDRDRDRTADLLREHHAAGRLEPEEFNERLDRVFAARTIGELDELLADLPAIDAYPLPAASLPPRGRSSASLPADSVLGEVASGHGRLSPAWRAAWASWASVTLVCVVVWLLTGAGYPWPLWVAGPWGAMMAGRWILGTHPGDSGHGGGRPDGSPKEIGGPRDDG
ncbi:MAG: DUF1707 SHOCT-like domain-containing protein [Streptosporangiaceae bacterium]